MNKSAMGLALLSLPLLAESTVAAAHEHGVADLTVALADNQLLIQLDSPMANLVGFEGPADSPQRQQAVAGLQAKLQSPLLAVTGCQQVSLEAPLPAALMASDDHGHEEHADHEEHDHDEHGDHEEHDHEEHADHDDHDHDEHDHEEHQHDAHMDLEASWTFQCQAGVPVVLHSRLFDSFPGISSMRVQWLTDSRQGAETWQQDQPLVLSND
ncbi:ZrgA family zinc uptake protein [Oceanobacter mangrovi]|uniref:ZrgA family zinc uptake protein n=1 Tax=Oceanobacter mangrovi TaxID=2862510 RepID=UPI001C8D8A13|nr:DUF2796 domain-containing protein [Oceanobacter mangrovi]